MNFVPKIEDILLFSLCSISYLLVIFVASAPCYLNALQLNISSLILIYYCGSNPLVSPVTRITMMSQAKATCKQRTRKLRK